MVAFYLFTRPELQEEKIVEDEDSEFKFFEKGKQENVYTQANEATADCSTLSNEYRNSLMRSSSLENEDAEIAIKVFGRFLSEQRKNNNSKLHSPRDKVFVCRTCNF